MTYIYCADLSSHKHFSPMLSKHARYMDVALREAQCAADNNDIPIGAVLVSGNTIVARGHNTRISTGKQWHHAEIVCLQKALKNSINLSDMILYTTHMPCIFCAGAIVQFGIKTVVAGNHRTFLAPR